jgi:hypothetical protein
MRAPAAERGVIRRLVSLNSDIVEFREIVDAIYGTYLDACEGFARVRSRAAEIEEEGLRSYENAKTKHPELSHLPFGGTDFAYGRWIPAGSQPRYRHLHQVPIEALRRRNEEGGSNFQFIGNVCVVTLFQYWEDDFRLRFAQELGLEKNDLQVPLFGELRYYRHAIIHNHGRATAEVEECVLLKGPRRGEPLLIRRPLFEEIIDGILEFLHRLQENPEQFTRCA